MNQSVLVSLIEFIPDIPHHHLRGDIVVANTHLKRVILNNPLPRLGQFLRSYRLSLPDLFQVHRVHFDVVRNLGKENVREILHRWEPKLPAPQRGKWMTDRDMRRGIKLALLLRLDGWPPKRILDIGCGTGFFLHICKRFGHAVLGLDLPEQEMFKEWTAFLEIPGVGYRIQAFTALPSLGQKFDLITMDSLTFDRNWSDKEWRFFLNDLKEHLMPNGRVYAMLKFSGKSKSLSTKEIRAIFSEVPGYSTKFLSGRQVVLTKNEAGAFRKVTRVVESGFGLSSI